jgi:glycine cleavage system P protein (glycine dehydrogenase)
MEQGTVSPATRLPIQVSYTALRTERFVLRHLGPRRDDVEAMVAELGYDSLDAFADAVVPEDIRLQHPLDLPPGRSERDMLQALRGLAAQNRVFRS